MLREGVVKARVGEDVLSFEGVGEDAVRRTLRLEDDLPTIRSGLCRDRYMERVVTHLYGLRLVRQDPWECLVSFMCATYKNVPAIQRMILNISKRWGEPISFEGRVFHTFPEASALADVGVAELRKCGLGFRAENVVKTARIVKEGGLKLDALRNSSYREAKEKLKSLPGVGSKVADCVLLFSLEEMTAFPVDVWIKRAILNHYPRFFSAEFAEKTLRKNGLTRKEYERINGFGRSYFGEYAGYAQQYIYAYSRLFNRVAE